MLQHEDIGDKFNQMWDRVASENPELEEHELPEVMDEEDYRIYCKFMGVPDVRIHEGDDWFDDVITH